MNSIELLQTLTGKELVFSVHRLDLSEEKMNSIDLLWTLKGIEPVLSNHCLELSKCKFSAKSMEQSEWNLLLSTSLEGIEACFQMISSSKDQLEVDFDIRMITAEGRRWKSGFVGKRDKFTHRDGRSGPLASWAEVLDARTGLLFGDTVRVSVCIWPSKSISYLPATLSARSRAGIAREVTWKVPRFSSLGAEHEIVHLVPDSDQDRQTIVFVLFFHQGEVCVRFYCDDDEESSNLMIMMEAVYIYQNNETKVTCWEGKCILREGCDTCYLPFIKRSSLTENRNYFLPQDTLTVVFQVIDYLNPSICSVDKCVWGGKPTKLSMSTCSSHSDSLKLPTTRTVEDLSVLLDKAIFSDFHVNVGEESIPVHKAVLYARSPVFATMLASPMRESCENSVNVPDFEPDSVRRLLRFLYSGAVPDMSPTNAGQLYSLADKYRVLELRNMCADELVSGLSASAQSVCDALSLSDRHSDGELKAHVVEYVRQNKKKVLQSSQWVAFMQKYPMLALEVTYEISLETN